MVTKCLISDVRKFAVVLLLSAGCAHDPARAERERAEERALWTSGALLADAFPPRGSVYTTKIYVIRRGDRWPVIAKRFNLSEDQLARLNPGVIPTKLKPGMRVRVAEERVPFNTPSPLR